MLKIIIVMMILSPYVFAGDYSFKIRAREHFETHEFSSSTVKSTYKGLNNTINLWWEKPYDISYGFSFSPVISSLKSTKATDPFGDKITFVNVGFELKYFFTDSMKQVFVRPGFGYSEVNKDIGLASAGNFVYLGLGYEVPFKSFGLAFEFAQRYADLGDGLTVNSITPSIGLHFYKVL